MDTANPPLSESTPNHTASNTSENIVSDETSTNPAADNLQPEPDVEDTSSESELSRAKGYCFPDYCVTGTGEIARLNSMVQDLTVGNSRLLQQTCEAENSRLENQVLYYNLI